MIKYLLDNKVDINCVDNDGDDPLILISVYGNFEIIIEFLKRNINYQRTNKNGINFYTNLCLNNHFKTIRLVEKIINISNEMKRNAFIECIN